ASMPTDRRTVAMVIPAIELAPGVPWEWVVVAGWQTSERTSPMLTRHECSLSASMNAQALALTSSSDAPSGTARSNVTIAPAPLGDSFFCSALYGEDARPAYCTLDTSSRASSHSATRCALATWR